MTGTIDYTKPVVFRKVIWAPENIADGVKLNGNRIFNSENFIIGYDDKEFEW
jgi:hypothetical protein